MINLSDWAARWGVPRDALIELERMTGMHGYEGDREPAEASESRVQSLVRLEASAKGMRLFRNNVGALEDSRGRFVRYGIANDSKAMNTQFKSGDLIGIRPHIVTPSDVGKKFGLFLSRECKRGGWTFNPNDAHEQAQWRWMQFVNMMGGDAAFAAGEGTL